MLTTWGESFDKNHVLEEYPRPQMRRDSFLNLNGIWDYAICSQAEQPERFDGEIVVPYSPEAPLSGVLKTLAPDEFLWYRKVVSLPEDFNRGRLMLQFGAVEQATKALIDGKEVKSHVGGDT